MHNVHFCVYASPDIIKSAISLNATQLFPLLFKTSTIVKWLVTFFPSISNHCKTTGHGHNMNETRTALSCLLGSGSLQNIFCEIASALSSYHGNLVVRGSEVINSFIEILKCFHVIDACCDVSLWKHARTLSLRLGANEKVWPGLFHVCLLMLPLSRRGNYCRAHPLAVSPSVSHALHHLLSRALCRSAPLRLRLSSTPLFVSRLPLLSQQQQEILH